MKAYDNFIHELNKLVAFYKATIYAYEQTEELLIVRKSLDFNLPKEWEFALKPSSYFKINQRSKLEIKKNLCETIFVRVVSSLEVFLIDLVRDVFLINKLPFKNSSIHEFNQSEILSFVSTTELFSKIINKECRKLSNGGFLDIIKYYKRIFKIDIGGLDPGKSVIEEYHDRRHLLVHRLGKTDQIYRKKYNFEESSILVTEDYLIECIKDFKKFSFNITNNIKFQLENLFTEGYKSLKEGEQSMEFKVEILKEKIPPCFDKSFSFWVGEELCILDEILERKNIINDKNFEFYLSGKSNYLSSYYLLLKRLQRKEKIKLSDVKMTTNKYSRRYEKYKEIINNEKLLSKIKEKLIIQPWPIGIHKTIAAELNIQNSVVSDVIRYLISQKTYKKQAHGELLE